MKKLAFVLAAAGLMTVASCDPQTNPQPTDPQADLSPLSAPPVDMGDTTPSEIGSPSTSPDTAPDTDYLTVQRSISSAMPDEEEE